MSLSREEIIRIAIGTARENGHFRRCFLTDQDLEKIADIAYAAGAAAEREQCAMVCDRFQGRGVGMQPAECAAAIRARNGGGK